ncbi:acetyl/propionyl-CoA carboxylase alpha subunit/acetyl-CoA carboxylase carboxyltransferase component [Sulfitobacter undariae]|uniref:Acetyl/propionyl-CoA carboxylase alpha subunit/acetyl-CoA carboxylase carboxyltransferase component n=1 Tax=Sulfitobacter undariae TaxID=1563671 RepID=A0A7W6E7G0_9RHOB|nr:carboxyl transferase domain-containing protein [Sulfitobacter undariae]MBB3994856.1 acetyl/propionyl-CoA carboxylase alpha subunit/acetyl-CoA carboxylase carboxyltransferase component [Sulfitobacter undariae]
MIKKLLIANRGEIAIRVARTAAAMGIQTVAVHTADDATSLHTKHADELRKLPGAGVSGYLDGQAMIAIAQETGCDAVHPGYGFLSERADFAQACSDAGITFVGPTAETLRMQGDKVSARALAETAGVPVLRGSKPLTSVADVLAFFDAQQGAALMIKAVNGGGGRGMRIVRSAEDAETAFAQATAEAQSAFGDGALYAERFLESVRHIEVQIIGDGTHVTHLWERDCSVQRRHQKVIELAPAPHLNEDTRTALLEASIAIGRACQYRGLGTVEFLVEANGAFHFIETNPRIQVEHTITEEITGLDLVEIQLAIASGASLADVGLSGPPPAPIGYSVQTRINTERLDQDGTFTPTGGRLGSYNAPTGPGVRIDGYAYPGYSTNPNFDPMLAKLVIHEKSGDLARLFAKAERALSEFQIDGVETNIGFLRSLLKFPAIADWSVDVRTLDTQMHDLVLTQNSDDRFFSNAKETAEGEVALPQGTEALRAPMQAMIQKIYVSVGDTIAKGQEIALIEAMKMQHTLVAEAGGVVVDLFVLAGETVAPGAPVLAFTPDDTLGEVETQDVTPAPDHIRPDLGALQNRISRTLDESRPKAVTRRRSRDQRTTREIIDALCVDGDFHEYGQLVLAGQRRKLGLDALIDISPADGIVTGVGSINAGQFPEKTSQVALMAYDSTVMAGTQGYFGHLKTDRMLEVARDQGLATVFFTEGGGGRPNDDDFALTVQSGLKVTTFAEYARLQGWGPKITVNSGYCFAGNAALFGAGDIRIATRNSWIGLAGPAMIEAGGIGSFHPKEIGPAPMHAKNGLLDYLAEDDDEAISATRKVLSYFQGNSQDWQASDQRLLRHVIPENRKKTYLVRPVIEGLADIDSFMELGAQHAQGMITGFMRIEGRPMGVIANNPQHLGGALDAQASAKGARFLTLCSRFKLPVLSLCDTPGFMVGPASEEEGSVRAACDLIAAGATLTAPMFFVCLRKAYGIGAQAMAAGSLGEPTFAIAWPTGEFGPMGLEGAVQLGYRKELEAETDPDAREALYNRLVDELYVRGGAMNVASTHEIDAVIDPAETRGWIAKGMRMNTHG